MHHTSPDQFQSPPYCLTSGYISVLSSLLIILKLSFYTTSLPWLQIINDSLFRNKLNIISQLGRLAYNNTGTFHLTLSTTWLQTQFPQMCNSFQHLMSFFIFHFLIFTFRSLTHPKISWKSFSYFFKDGFPLLKTRQQTCNMVIYTKAHITKPRFHYNFVLSQKWNLKLVNQESPNQH